MMIEIFMKKILLYIITAVAIVSCQSNEDIHTSEGHYITGRHGMVVSAHQLSSPEGYVSEETTHYSVVDEYGNAVSATTTINGWYGSSIVVDGAGFLLNNEMDDFSVKPGVPNISGLVGGEANSV